jgi:hypothetical protein
LLRCKLCVVINVDIAIFVQFRSMVSHGAVSLIEK